MFKNDEIFTVVVMFTYTLHFTPVSWIIYENSTIKSKNAIYLTIRTYIGNLSTKLFVVR